MLMAAEPGPVAPGPEPVASSTTGRTSAPREHHPTSGQLSRAQRLRVAGNLVNFSTLAGLLLARLGGCSRRSGPYGLALAEGYRFSFPVASAFTVGDVVITAHTFAALQQRVPRLLEHEERHSWQYFWCLGLPFLVPYTLAMGWSMLRTGDRAARNFFERSAGLADGGYVDVPVVSLTALLRRVPTWLRGLRSPRQQSLVPPWGN